jgi:hypothetical protein
LCEITVSNGSDYEEDWDVETCSLVDTDVLEVLTTSIALMMEAVSISETSVNFYETTRQYISEQ